MKFETGKEKIQKICDILKKETLEPAKQEAREIVENAHLQAADIVKEAKKKAESLLAETQKELEEKQKVFQASLQLACRQGIDLLKQKIEQELFDKQLTSVVADAMKNPKLISELLSSLVRSIEEKGIEDDLVAWIPKDVTPRMINAQLAATVLERFKNQSVAVGDFDGGVKVQFLGNQITLDISDAAVRELIALYIRRDFRDLVFNR